VSKNHSQPTVGDILQIPLSNGKIAYGRYVYWDGRKPSGMGSLVEIYDFFSAEPVESGLIDTLSSKPLLFPPVFVGLGAAIKSGRWSIVGHIPVFDFTFPEFRSTFGTGPEIGRASCRERV